MPKITVASVLPMLMLGTANQKNAEKVCVLINKQGRARYCPVDGEKESVLPGALLLNNGQIQLSNGASVLLYSNGQYVRLEEEGLHKLADVFKTGGMQKLNFDARFGRYIMAAVDLVVHAGDDDGWGELSGSKGGGDGWGELSGSKGGGDGWGELSGSKGGGDGWGELSGSKGGGDGWGELSGSKGGGDGWGELSGSKGGGDGWGDRDGRIVPILPFGKIPAGPIIFQWSQPQPGQSFVLEILDETDGIVHSTGVNDNWAQVNLGSLTLKTDQQYVWRINVPEHPENTSTKARIQIVDQSGDEIVAQKVEKSAAYQIQDPVLDGLMEAVVLEEAEHFYEAYQRYEMIRQSYQKNSLVKLMQAAFYLRHQLRPRAVGLFGKKN